MRRRVFLVEIKPLSAYEIERHLTCSECIIAYPLYIRNEVENNKQLGDIGPRNGVAFMLTRMCAHGTPSEHEGNLNNIVEALLASEEERHYTYSEALHCASSDFEEIDTNGKVQN